MSATLLAASLSWFINSVQLRQTTNSVSNKFEILVQVRAALPFMWLSALYLVNNRADLIMLGSLRGAYEAGIYAVASRAGEFVTFIAVAANMVLAPQIARLHHKGDKNLLQRMLSGAILRVSLLTLPLACIFIIAAHPLLFYLYGQAYTAGTLAMQILVGAQTFGVITGPKGLVLNMAGYEKLSALGTGLSVITNIILNAILIPLYGVNGAAIATSMTMVLLSILLWLWVHQRLHLRLSVLGI
jgi:O-antigen/teichoic acid export membrane protein